MATNFKNSRFVIDAETRLSVSTWLWNNGTRYNVAVGLFRKRSGKWELDGETCREFSGEASRKWLVDFSASDYEDALYRSVTGHVTPMGFYANNRVGSNK